MIPTNGQLSLFTAGSERESIVVEKIDDAVKLNNADLIPAKKTKSERIKANEEVLQILAKPETLSHNELKKLSTYSGWGGVPDYFKNEDNLVRKTNPDDYDKIQRSILSSYFTPDNITSAIASVFGKFDIKNASALEPSAGIGAFIQALHAQKIDCSFTAIEPDPISNKILNTLFNINVLNHPFEKCNLQNKFDLIVGNPPYGDIKVHDTYNKHLSGDTYHNYFLKRCSDLLADDGIMAMVVTRHFLDKKEMGSREYIAQECSFLGAIRLPSNTFNQTTVIADIVFFRKQKIGISNINWLSTKPDEFGTSMNQYYHDNPDNILGDMVEVSTPFGKTTSVKDSGLDIKERIVTISNQFLKKEYGKAIGQELPATVSSNSESEHTFIPNEYIDSPLGGVFFYQDNIYRRSDEEWEDTATTIKASLIETTDDLYGLYVGYIGIRELFYKLVEREKANYDDDTELEDIRKELDNRYTDFVDNYGHLNTKANRKYLSLDVQYLEVSGLEVVSVDQNKNMFMDKADILSTRTIFNKKEVTYTKSIEALPETLNEFGYVNIDHIINICPSLTKENILNELTDEIIYDPIKERYELRSLFLSGNIGHKIDKIEQILVKKEKSPDIDSLSINQTNEALSELNAKLPEKISWTDIKVNFGVTWLPPEIYVDFIKSYNTTNSLELIYSDNDAKALKIKNIYMSSESKIEFTTESVSPRKMFDHCFNNTYPTVTYKENGATYVDQEKTEIAISQRNKVFERWADWIFSEPERTKQIEDLYNNLFNRTIRPIYDGSFIKFENKISDDIIRLEPHQKNAIFRVMCEQNTLLDHSVGLGKTFSMIASAVKCKEAGLISKAMIATVDSVVPEVAEQARALFPSLNIFAPSEKDLSKANRSMVLSGITTSANIDIVLISHTTLGLIEFSQKEQIIQSQEVLDDLMLEKADAEEENYSSVRVTKSIEKLEYKIKDLQVSREKNSSAKFDNMGIDMLIIDEADLFKNLLIPTKLKCRGINQQSSQRAMDLFQKVRHIQNHNGKVVFATATPVSNSIAELYVFQKYLDQARLFQTFDSWIKAFGTVSSDWEINAVGQYKQVSRLREFQNIPELSNQISLYTDSVYNEDVEGSRTKKELPVLSGGKPTLVISEITHVQQMIFDELTRQYEFYSGKKPEKGAGNVLTVITDARKASIHPCLYNSDLPLNTPSKLDSLADKVWQEYQKYDEHNGTQLVFMNFGIPDAKKPFNTYDCLRSKLVARGILSDEIDYAQNPKNRDQKFKLKENINKGELRVVIGSIAKMGVGCNYNERLTAIHIADPPMRPRDLEQAEGRIIRRGNILLDKIKDFEVSIYRYGTKNTLDPMMWQLVETKAKFIAQLKKGSCSERTAEDISHQSISAEEMKAITSGDKLLLKQMVAQKELKDMKIKMRALTNKDKSREYQIDLTNGAINRLNLSLTDPKYLTQLEIAKKLSQHTVPELSKIYPREEMDSFIKQCNPRAIKESTFEGKDESKLALSCMFGNFEIEYNDVSYYIVNVDHHFKATNILLDLKNHSLGVVKTDGKLRVEVNTLNAELDSLKASNVTEDEAIEKKELGQKILDQEIILNNLLQTRMDLHKEKEAKIKGDDNIEVKEEEVAYVRNM